jgi:hypothetical protein
MLGAVLVMFAVATPAAQARDKSGPFEIALHFTPQESVASSSPNLAPGISERPVKLVIEDARAGADPAVIGQSTDDDDKPWPVRVTNGVVSWSNEVLKSVAAEWGIKGADTAPLVLTGKVTRFALNESNKPVGSMYNADVKMAFTLSDTQGRVLWEGTAGGDAARYGKSRSADNANEVLSDAIKSTYSDAFNSPGLQDAWLGKKTAGGSMAGTSSAPAAAAPAGPATTPSDLLAELVKLKKQGFDTGLLVDYVNKKTVRPALSADDMVKWKNAGMPQEVIKAALDRAGS